MVGQMVGELLSWEREKLHSERAKYGSECTRSMLAYLVLARNPTERAARDSSLGRLFGHSYWEQARKVE